MKRLLVCFLVGVVLATLQQVYAQCTTTPIDESGWNIVWFDSQDSTGAASDGRAIHCLDDDSTTMWHSKWQNFTPSYPHEIQLDLGTNYIVNGISVLSRHDSGAGKIKGFLLFLSMDGITWNNPEDAGNFTYSSISQPSVRGTRFFGGVEARYVRLVITSNYDNTAHIAIAELDLFQESGSACSWSGKHNQQVQISNIPKQASSAAPIPISASATSGLSLNYSIVSGPATIQSNVISLDGTPGMVVFSAQQAGDTSFYAAQAIDSFEVIDLASYYPTISTKLTDQKTLQMPLLHAYKIYASAAIPEPDFLSISRIELIHDGVIDTFTYENGSYFFWWTPSAYGLQPLVIRAVGSNGNQTSDSLEIDVTDQISDITVSTFDAAVIDFGTIGSQWYSGSYKLPQFVGAYDSIQAKFAVTCPSVPGGCDDWDRVAWVQYKAPDGDWHELFRYVTPYGKACQHSIDVTDYASLLQGNIELRMYIETWGTGGWKLDLDFQFFKGQPEYLYSNISEVWHGTYNFGDMSNLQPVPVKKVKLPDATVAAKLRLATTGHGWGSNNTGNAAEFYHATHHIKVNTLTDYTQNLWTTCNPNPDGCTGQAGTWQYNRAGWCPGSIAKPYFYDLTSFVGEDTLSFNYVFQESYKDLCNASNPNCINGTTCANCNDGYNPHYVVSAYMVSFSNAPLLLGISDPALTDELAPEISIYPCPAKEQFHLQVNQEVNRCVVTIHDISGTLVKTYFFNSSGELNNYTFTSYGMKPGAYFVKCTTEHNFSTARLIINE